MKGVATGDMGITKTGEKGPNYQPGMELHAKQTIFAEGCRGSLGKMLMEQFDLRANSDVQTYGIGIKELWDIDPAKSQPGKIVHTAGWPLDSKTYGGSFMYHLNGNQVVDRFRRRSGLSKTRYLSPYQEFQRFKQHPSIQADPGRRATRFLRRPCVERRRVPVDSEADLPGRHAGRLRGRDS